MATTRLPPRPCNIALPMNPVRENPGVADLWSGNAVVGGIARRYYTGWVEAPFSVKGVRSGIGVWKTEGREFTVGPDAFMLVNEGQSYELTIESAAFVHTKCLFFDPKLIADVAGSVTARRLLDEPAPKQREFSNALRPRDGVIQNLLETSRPLTDDDFVHAAEFLVAGEQERAFALDRLALVNGTLRADVFLRLERSADLMIEGAGQRLSLDRIAKESDLSPYHFHRLFRAAYKVTPLEFLTEQRLRRARRLLMTTDLDLDSICLSIGLESASSFSRLFKRRFGQSPGRYRNSQDRTEI